jgi:hypothetical protein
VQTTTAEAVKLLTEIRADQQLERELARRTARES